MDQKEIGKLNFALLRRESGEVLAQNANRLKLMEAVMVCLTPLLLYTTLFSTWQAVVLPLLNKFLLPVGVLLAELGLWMIVTALTLFFTLPLFTGLLFLASRMEAGEEAYLPEVFRAFGSRSAYRKALRISASLFWKLALLAAAETAIFLFFQALGDGSALAILLGIPFMIGAAILLVYWFCGGFLRTYFVLCIQNSAGRMCPHARPVGFSYWMGFMPWLVLSLMTFCILLLADVLPRMLIAYFRLCRKLDEMTVNSEE